MEVVLFLAGIISFIAFQVGSWTERSKARNEKLRQHTARIEALLTPVPVRSEGALPGEELESLPSDFIRMNLVERVDPVPTPVAVDAPAPVPTETGPILSDQLEVLTPTLGPIVSDELHVDPQDPQWEHRRFEAPVAP